MENYHLQNKIIQSKDKKLEEKHRQMEAQNKHLEERQQSQPGIQVINEGWDIMFGQAQEQIMLLFKENKEKSAELQEMSNQLQDRKATVEKIDCDLQYMDQRNQALQGKKIKKSSERQGKLNVMEESHRALKVKLNETLHQNKEFLQGKKRTARKTERRETSSPEL